MIGRAIRTAGVIVVVVVVGACGSSASNTPPPSSGAAQHGQSLAKSNGCVNCHSSDGSAAVGPTWKGIWGQTVTFDDGTTAVVDAAYIAESIRDPGAHRVKGFAVNMPTLALSDADIADLTAYIESLGPTTG
jgi:cytochrome c oxidase subunit II